MVSPSATAAELTTQGNKSFHRVVGNDGTQGAAAVNYIKNVLKATKVFVIDDGQPYGAGIVDEVKKGLGSAVVGEDKVQTDQTNFDATISKIKAAAPTWSSTVVTPTRPLRCSSRPARPASRRSSSASTASTTPASRRVPATAAEGTIVTCPCLPAAEAGGTFAADYKAEYGEAPGSYGDEGYDGATDPARGLSRPARRPAPTCSRGWTPTTSRVSRST